MWAKSSIISGRKAILIKKPAEPIIITLSLLDGERTPKKKLSTGSSRTHMEQHGARMVTSTFQSTMIFRLKTRLILAFVTSNSGFTSLMSECKKFISKASINTSTL